MRKGSDDTKPPRHSSPLAAEAPAGLLVERFESQGDEFMVVSWPVAPKTPVRTISPALAEVLQGVLDGSSNAEIAACRGTSVRTVANQVAALLRLYEVGSRVQLALRVSTMGRQ